MMNWRGTGISVFITIAAGFAVWGFRQNRPVVYPPDEPTSMKKTIEIKITSSAFENNSMIPARFTCDGENTSPPLEISGVPTEAKSLTLVMHDPDAPVAGGWTPLEVRNGVSAVAPSDLPLTGWTHWVKWNISPMTMTITEGQESEGVSGKGTGGNLTYQGPCPPSRGQSPLRRGDVPPSGTHRYFFKIYALDTILDLKTGATKGELEKAMTEHIIGQGELVGLYARQN